MGPEFFQTGMGKKFYQSDIPRIIKALEAIATELKRANDFKEKASEKTALRRKEENV